MTNEEAKNLLDNLIGMVSDNQESDYDTALKMGIKALSFIDDIQAEIRHFMLEINPSSSESDYACNYILDLIDKKMGKKVQNDKKKSRENSKRGYR